MKWFHQKDNKGKWFYDGEPCEIIAVGIMDDETSPKALKVLRGDGSEVDVVASNTG